MMLRSCIVTILILIFHLQTANSKRIRRVHLIFSNHLDIGFHSNLPDTPGNDAVVLSRYFRDYFPAAIKTAADLQERGGPERYTYLTHSFLVSLYLDCPKQLGIYCPSPDEITAFEDAVNRGDIVWHALPHNFQAEFMDSDLLQYATTFTHELDQRFNLPLKKVMSQRDVPGLTRAAIPILAYSGVTAISVGVNSGSAPPAVPKYTPFIWKDKRTRTSLIAFWHPGGYSDVPVDSAEHCIRARHFDHVLCGAWRGDNEGPHSVEEVLDIYNRTREAFRDAQVDVSTLDAFVTELEKDLPNLDLPVVTDEIGDTWIYGVASDPARTAEFRALLRLRRASGDRYDDAAFNKFSRLLLKIPEHTWGVDTKDYPGDYTRWSNIELQQALSTNDPKFMAAIDSWVRQRAYGTWALEELPENDLGRNVLAEMQQLKTPPNPTEPLYSEINVSQRPSALKFRSHAWLFELDQATGAISRLEFVKKPASRAKSFLQKLFFSKSTEADTEGCVTGCHNWASPENLLAKLVYSCFDEKSYDVIWKHYAHRRTPFPEWFIKDFGKPNATVLGGAKRQDAVPALQKVWQRTDGHGGLHVIAKAVFDDDLVTYAGAPAAVYYDISSPKDSNDLFIDIVWENKTATRLPEAMWLSWECDAPAVDPSSWAMSKLGQWISPLEVMRNGSMSMHAIDDGGISVRSGDGKSVLRVRSLDAVLVSPGRPTPFPSVVHLPDLHAGMHFNLVNNVWGTNYVMWWPYQESDRNMRFRFVVQIESPTAEQ